ncbi:hypothetical protein [Amycolatopsis sp. cmx-4-68]|uniref:hypothetical protein n=1 Tax=Amycolatopsis sp. cmx-4-68 TaxID=2790938 RepID=UPI00397ABB97
MLELHAQAHAQSSPGHCTDGMQFHLAGQLRRAPENFGGNRFEPSMLRAIPDLISF